MNLDLNPLATALARRQTLALTDRAGELIECLSGSLWITQDGDPRDVILGPGEGHVIDRDGLVLVYAFADAKLAVLAPASPTATAANP